MFDVPEGLTPFIDTREPQKKGSSMLSLALLIFRMDVLMFLSVTVTFVAAATAVVDVDAAVAEEEREERFGEEREDVNG